MAMFKPPLIALMLCAFSAVPAVAQQPAPADAHQPSAAMNAANPYAPYDWLIGDWYAEGGPGMLREQITYGPNRSYIRLAVFMATSKDAPQHLHSDGFAVWNAKTRMLDFLFVVEPGSGVQEKGTYRAEPDGSISREVELIDAKGGIATFRQTFHRTGADSAITALMRKTDTGWEPTFPGSDKIELKRKQA